MKCLSLNTHTAKMMYITRVCILTHLNLMHLEIQALRNECAEKMRQIAWGFTVLSFRAGKTTALVIAEVVGGCAIRTVRGTATTAGWGRSCRVAVYLYRMSVQRAAAAFEQDVVDSFLRKQLLCGIHRFQFVRPCLGLKDVFVVWLSQPCLCHR